MPSLRECAIAAKAKYDEIIKDSETKGDNAIALAAREFLFECAKKDDWDTAEYFRDRFCNTDFPLKKLNLVGDNNESFYWLAATNSDIAEANHKIKFTHLLKKIQKDPQNFLFNFSLISFFNS